MLQFTHVSNDKKQITLINPQAVNLDAYKEKLEQAIKSYERQVYSSEIYHVCSLISDFSYLVSICSDMLCSILVILHIGTLESTINL